MTHSSLGLVLVGAGSSNRMGGLDKVWADLGGEPLFMHSIRRLAPLAGATVVVVRQDNVEQARRLLGELPAISVVIGGTERRSSVANGIAALPLMDIIAIHDAARPFAEPVLLERGLELVRASSAAGAIPGVILADTLKEMDDDCRVVRTVDRGSVRAIQTPQVFGAAALRRAHETAPTTASATDDAALLEIAGFPVTVFPGDPTNFKVTTMLDLEIARALLARSRSD